MSAISGSSAGGAPRLGRASSRPHRSRGIQINRIFSFPRPWGKSGSRLGTPLPPRQLISRVDPCPLRRIPGAHAEATICFSKPAKKLHKKAPAFAGASSLSTDTLISPSSLYFLLSNLYSLSFSLHRHALRQIPGLIHIQPADGGDVIGQQLQRDHRHERAKASTAHPGTHSTWSAMSRSSSSPSVATAITMPPRALACWICEIIFSCQGSLGARHTTGMSSSINAMGPCFISPAG